MWKVPGQLELRNRRRHGRHLRVPAHALQDGQILHDEFAGGDHAHGLGLVEGRIDPAEHGEDETGRLATPIVGLQSRQDDQ